MNVEKMAYELSRAHTQDQTCEAVTNFNLMGSGEKIEVIHRLVKGEDHSAARKLIQAIEYRGDFQEILSDKGVYTFYLGCLIGTPREKEII
jgi:hypothetical protein